MSKPRSKLTDYKTREFREVRGFTTAIHFGKQEKHLPGRPGYDPSKSSMSIGIREIQRLVEDMAGNGRWEGANKEVIDFGVEIGVHRTREPGSGLPTTRGTIHYSKTGAHIVPAVPTVIVGRDK